MKVLTRRDIKNIIENNYNVELATRSRKRHFVYFRYIYYKLCKDLIPDSTLDSIGKMVDRDHSSVTYGLSEFPYIEKCDKEFAENYKKIKAVVLEEANKLENIINNSKKTYGVINVKKIHPHLLRYAKKPLREVLVKRGQVAKRSNGLPKN